MIQLVLEWKFSGNISPLLIIFVLLISYSCISASVILSPPNHFKKTLVCRADPAAGIARLSALLHAKEMENLRVSRELEETKAMLALVRAKHSAELAQAKLVAVEQDLRLHASEQALNSLKLVRFRLGQVFFFLSRVTSVTIESLHVN